jgi:hypothetical protein
VQRVWSGRATADALPLCRSAALPLCRSAALPLCSYPVLEYDYRAIVNGQKLSCRYCGKKYLPPKLTSHNKYSKARSCTPPPATPPTAPVPPPTAIITTATIM